MSMMTSPSRDLPAGTTFPWIADGLALGGDWSPEQWPEETWVEDVALMRRAGVNSINLAVFSWGLLEVADGEFDFGWLDRVMDLLADAGIGVNLATPTAAPPIWLWRAHPEIGRVDDRGVRASQGGRLGWSPHSPVFRRYALRLVETMAARYAAHPALRLWHVSNELGNENHHCWSDEASAAFARWLEARHGTVEAMEQHWGSAFWGHRYTSFDQVQVPRWTGTSHNPGLLLDFERFSSDALLDHHRAEREVLRRVTPGVPVTTNFMVQNHPGVHDYAGWAREVDLVANDHYTIAADPERWGELSFSADRVRGMSGGQPWLLIEHSTSAVNWQPRNRAKSPGEMIRNSLAHVARGADGTLFFQWRQSTAGSEQHHSSAVPHAGPDTKVFREVEQLGALLQGLSEVRGSTVERARVAILFSEVSAAAMASSNLPSVDLRALDQPLAFHRALTRLGVAVDVVAPTADLTGYELVVVATTYLLEPEAAAGLDAVVAAGGTVVVTPFSGIVDVHGRVLEGGYPGALRELLGVRVEEVFPLLEGATVALSNGWRGEVWTELGAPRAWGGTGEARVTASYADGQLAGEPALYRRDVEGGGSALYLSTHLDAPSLAAFVDELVAERGLAPVAEGDAGLERVRRTSGDASWLFAINHADEPQRVVVTGTDLVTGQEAAGELVVPAGGVAVVRERTP
ncbi:beta-galactosidase [Frigoribacterium salinisoli]